MEDNTRHAPSAPEGNAADNSTLNNELCEQRLQVINPADVVDPIDETQCQNIKDNHGINGNRDNNCEDLTGELLCDIKQVLEYVLNMGPGVIFPNEDSKCQEDDPSPTLASMWSRIYRFTQAVTCILCAYDPFINTLLKAGRFPQVLMGAFTEDQTEMDGCCKKWGYPTWVTPDDYPTLDSNRPVTAFGIAKAIEDAILSVWHKWKEEPEFTYFAQTMDDANDPYSVVEQMKKWPAKEGDTLLLANSPECGSGTGIYEYRHDNDPSGDLTVKWRLNECVKKDGKQNLKNFAVTHITNGYYEEKGVYFFDETWQVLDADLGTLESRVDELERIFEHSVLSQDNTTQYVMATRPDLTTAKAVPCTNGKETLVFITG